MAISLKRNTVVSTFAKVGYRGTLATLKTYVLDEVNKTIDGNPAAGLKISLKNDYLQIAYTSTSKT